MKWIFLIKKAIVWVGLVAIIGTQLISCGLHARSSSDIPAELRTLYLESPNLDIPLLVELKRTLQSLGVHFTDSPASASVILRITNYTYSHDTPTLIYSGNATAYTYSLTVTFLLLKRDGKTVIFNPTHLDTSGSLLQNANQVYTPNATVLMERQLTRTMTLTLLNYLISPGMHKTLYYAFKKPSRKKHTRHSSHAIRHQTTHATPRP